MYDTTVTVIGRLVADPVVRQTRDGAPMLTFRMATNGRRQKPGAPGQFEDGPTSFYNVCAFRSLATNGAFALQKGQPVIVTGVMEITPFERQDGSRGASAEISARSIGHDLTWGITAFRKVVRGAGGNGTPMPGGRESAEAYAQALADIEAGRVQIDDPDSEFAATPGGPGVLGEPTPSAPEGVDPVTGEIRDETTYAA